MWEYLDLTNEQKLARRAVLDRTGYRVVLSQLLVCAVVWAYGWLMAGKPVHRRRRERGSVLGALKRVEWMLADPLSLRYPELRCLGDWLAVLAWAAWCVFLALSSSVNDYFHMTKAFGMVGAANLPLHLVLAMKRSPLRWLGALSYEGRANFLHRWLGRTVSVLLAVHAALYLAYFWAAGRMTTRLLDLDVLCGVFALLAIGAIDLSANRYVRQASYRTFAVLHAVLAPLLFPLLFLHVSHLRPYLLAAAVFYAADRLLRYVLRVPALASVSRLAADPGLIEISACLDFGVPIRPGSHAIVRHPESSPWTAHPFSITAAVAVPSSSPGSSGPSSASSGSATAAAAAAAAAMEGKRVRMVARVHGNFTKRLSSLAAAPNGIRTGLRLYLDLPYGASPLHFSSPSDILRKHDKILFVAGGVGATFAVSWVRYLLASPRPGEPAPAATVRPGQLRFVWAVRRPQDALWAFEPDHHQPGDPGPRRMAEAVELFVTGGASAGANLDGEMERGIEMAEAVLPGAPGGVRALLDAGVAPDRLSTGRPHLPRLIRSTVRRPVYYGGSGDDDDGDGDGGGGSGDGDGEGCTAILVCGPPAMGVIARRAAARLGMAGADIWLHVEEFGH